LAARTPSGEFAVVAGGCVTRVKNQPNKQLRRFEPRVVI
jgi:hypothetical protein